jgi:hypothetical protein
VQCRKDNSVGKGSDKLFGTLGTLCSSGEGPIFNLYNLLDKRGQFVQFRDGETYYLKDL